MDVESGPGFATHGDDPEDSVTKLQNTKATSTFSMAYWQKYFDLEEEDMRERIMACAKPHVSSLHTILVERRNDLYGPFWIATTLVVLLFIAGEFSVNCFEHLDFINLFGSLV